MTVLEFGAALRQQRERRGVALAAIARTTKISLHLLEALERGDVSRWPNGIYRRAFVRAYAAAIGLPPEPTLAEFLRLFPDPGQDRPAMLDDDDPRRLRVMLMPEPRWKAPALRSSAALVDAGMVALAAMVASRYTTFGFWMPAAITGLAYHAAAALLLGRSPGAWLVTSRAAAHQASSLQGEVARLRQDLVVGLAEAEASRGPSAAT